jgi:Putative prokaryotic signal transducing protein
MYCPECGGEYREGFSRCADCDVALVKEPPKEEEHSDSELVTVFETGDPAELSFVESLLLEAGIPYSKKGESVQDLFGLGRLGPGFSPITGPVAVQVFEEHAEAATQLLEELPAVEPPELESE